ncbi:class I SAM-dependent methyltransferase [Rhodophyticola porphyridii]|uniref:Class I SAM-dependent methyltransferase n=1 Tax=Rhodophyticola porphyridii TaxID=1852017 RepID=A0A3L9Y8B8_9RHOB|nr:class I SAM-dependent methyltransferase [Rhodophyticola porphyridii]RMA42563.1 class I SAM-dependent methyltransferase [Rhodophyticola porphyridii]
MGSLTDQVVAGYEAAADVLIPRYDGLNPTDILHPVLDLIPQHPVAALDIGAGPGTTAVWLAEQGHSVTATEPCAAFRAALSKRAPWLTALPDRLPHLAGVRSQFDLILVSGVWHHIVLSDRPAAWRRLSALLHQTGLALLSLRHGPGPTERPAVPCDTETEIALAEAAGLSVTRRVDTGSVQTGNASVGVTWTWLSLQKAAAP